MGINFIELVGDGGKSSLDFDKFMLLCLLVVDVLQRVTSWSNF